MKETGIVRRLDKEGRLVIPNEIRKTLGIRGGSPVVFWLDGKRLSIEKYEKACAICGSDITSQTIIVAGEDKRICSTCIKAIIETQ